MTTIEKLEKQIEELKVKVERLKNKEDLERTEHYYFINIDGDGDFYIDENTDGMTTENYNNWNYFLSEDSAEYFNSVLCHLRELQHLHEIYCPDYIPDWNDDEIKYYVIFDKTDSRYEYYKTTREVLDTIYFDSEETAKKVCERLNKNL